MKKLTFSKLTISDLSFNISKSRIGFAIRISNDAKINFNYSNLKQL